MSKTLNRAKLRRLAKIVKATGARIVLSSKWRLYKDYTWKLERNLGYRGLTIWGVTPDIDYPTMTRSDEIEVFLRTHPGIHSFIILDDLPRSEFSEKLRRRLIQTDGNKGLQEIEVIRAIAMLGRKE